MNVDVGTVRLLGAAFLFVFVASLLSERLLASAVRSGSKSEILVNISERLTLMRISNLIALMNCVGIVVLAALLYVVFYEQYTIVALVALGWWLAEAITLAVSKIGSYALIPLSLKFVEAGAPESSHFQTQGDFLYNGVDRQGYDFHILFFCLGAILWYYLFYQSGYVPSALSLWGLVSVSLLTIPVLLVLYKRAFRPAMVMGILYLPFELVFGIWLIVKGFDLPGVSI